MTTEHEGKIIAERVFTVRYADGTVSTARVCIEEPIEREDAFWKCRMYIRKEGIKDISCNLAGVDSMQALAAAFYFAVYFTDTLAEHLYASEDLSDDAYPKILFGEYSENGILVEEETEDHMIDLMPTPKTFAIMEKFFATPHPETDSPESHP